MYTKQQREKHVKFSLERSNSYESNLTRIKEYDSEKNNFPLKSEVNKINESSFFHKKESHKLSTFDFFITTKFKF